MRWENTISLPPLAFRSGSASVIMHASNSQFILLFFWLSTLGTLTTKQYHILTANITDISNATNGAKPEYASTALFTKVSDVKRSTRLTHVQGLLDPRRQPAGDHRLLPSRSWPSDPHRRASIYICAIENLAKLCRYRPCSTDIGSRKVFS